MQKTAYRSRQGLPCRLATKIVRIMKLTSVLLLVLCLHVSATTFSQSITFSGKGVSLEKVFSEIKHQTGYVVWGKSELLHNAHPVTLSAKQMPLTDFLDVLLQDQSIRYKIAGNTIMLFGKHEAETGAEALLALTPVTGRVTDSLGGTLIGATVTNLDTHQSTMTNTAGEFTLEAAAGHTLRVSFVGYRSREVVITAGMVQAKRAGNIGLSLSTSNLAALNVSANTGYQNIPKERATGAFGIVTEKTLSTRLETNVLDRLEGTVPGLFMNNGGVNIRGLATLYGNQAPLYVVDGFPYEGDINFINPSDVVNVTVMKDAAAASIYGTRAANGVISITTRSGGNHKTKVNFSSSIQLTPVPDEGKLHFLDSREMVDLQQEYFNIWHPGYTESTQRSRTPGAITALYNAEQGIITQQQLDSTLNNLRQANGPQQWKDLYSRNSARQRYALSVDGGNDIQQYNLSMNYTGSKGNGLRSGDQQVNIGLKEKVKVFKWLDADAGIATNLTKGTFMTLDPTSMYLNMPYEVLKNPDGSYASFTQPKSEYEIQRLKDLGLYDETYNPLVEMNQSFPVYSSNYFRLQGGFTVKFMPGLSLDIKYQTERGAGYNKTYYTANSYYVKSMINDATQIVDGQITRNVPDGGQVAETRSDSHSYTARAQLNFDRKFGSRHRITALAGGERRDIVSASTSVFRMGYSDNNLQFLPVDQIALGSLKGTESLTSNFSLQYNNNNNFSYGEDRYISGYGNVGYTYNDKYNLTGSVRVDNSNLFGTDPRYRYLPLWSAGASWHIMQEDFLKDVAWLNNLTLRTTYGLGGNVARTVGPYLQAQSSFFLEGGATATDIIYPPNKSLRWEKTASTNIGLDFAVLQNRISGSVDYYIRHTTDLLGQRATDPTNAFPSALINYGAMTNKGFELALNTVNVRGRTFNWSSNLALSINHNKMTRIDTRTPDIYGMTNGYGVDVVGKPMDALYSFRYAGLDPTNGTEMVYDASGKVVKNYDSNGNIVSNMTDVNGLVYSGTLRPKYTIGFTNSVSWKQLTLNVILIANGGNALRDVVGVQGYYNVIFNQDSRVKNFWRKPGDEKNPSTIPAPDLQGNGGSYFSTMWFAADKNILKADYIKVRDISLMYTLPGSVWQNKFSSARFTLQVQNPFAWFRNGPGIDPEAYYMAAPQMRRTTPIMPTYMAGFDLNF